MSTSSTYVLREKNECIILQHPTQVDNAGRVPTAVLAALIPRSARLVSTMTCGGRKHVTNSVMLASFACTFPFRLHLGFNTWFFNKIN